MDDIKKKIAEAALAAELGDDAMDVDKPAAGEAPPSSATQEASASSESGKAAHEASVSQIVEMGFTAAQAEYALKNNGESQEAALNWLLNADEASLKTADAPTADAPAKTAKSIRCVDTGKLFRTMADAMIYAERTGHANFEETDQEIPPLTAEEKAERVRKVKELLKEKAKEKEILGKKEELEREKKRRAEAQNMHQAREELEAIQRKRDAEARDREKARFKAEQDRLLEEVARDKAERAMEKARRLGTGDPKKAYDEAYAKAIKGHGDGADKPLEEKVEALLQVLQTLRAGNKGLEAARTVIKMLSNIKANPGEAKFRRVNLQNETFKAKVGSVTGGLALLKLAGFTEVGGADGSDGKFLELSSAADLEPLSKTLDLVSAAERAGRLG